MNYPRKYGNYVLLERLGIGGMSEVDLARQRMGDRDFIRFVVIKRIKTDRSGDDAFIRMFKDEARITSELHHECIGQVYEFGRQEDEYFLALEYVPGIDVRGIINALRERGQRVPVRVALRILCDVLEGLEYAHRKRDAYGKPMRIVHRDVNPRNIMVSIHGDTKLIDFGVAKASDRLERTKTDHVKGKFSYMAPEQVTGGDIDHRADLFAVGLTLHEFLAGYGPFFGLNQVQIVHRLLHGQLPQMPSVRDLPDEDALRKVHDKALAPDARNRYQTAGEFRKALEAVADEVGGLPKREQIARFLQKVDPGLTERLQDKMRGYSGELDLTTQAGSLGPAPSAPPEDVSGTMDSQVAPRPIEATGTQMTVTTGRAVAGVAGLFTIVAGAVLGTVLLTLALVFWLEPWNRGGGPEVEPVLVQPVTPDPQPVAPKVPDPRPVAPEPVAPVEPEPVEPRPEPVAPRPEPVAPRPEPVAPRPEPVTPRPEPVEPAPVEPAPVEPEPVVPEPVVPPPEPVVEPEPPKPPPEPVPDPALNGSLLVNAPERGLSVSIDGSVRGKTPLQLKLPPGTYTVEVDGYGPKRVTVRTRQNSPAIFN